MAKEIVGRVRSIAINDHKVSFVLDPKEGPHVRVVLYADPPNTALVPQTVMATRSWMFSLLQSAFTSARPVTAKVDESDVVLQLELALPPLVINPDLGETGKSPIPFNG